MISLRLTGSSLTAGASAILSRKALSHKACQYLVFMNTKYLEKVWSSRFSKSCNATIALF